MLAFTDGEGQPDADPVEPRQYDVPEAAPGVPELYPSGGPPVAGSSAVVPPLGVVTVEEPSKDHVSSATRGGNVAVAVGVLLGV